MIASLQTRAIAGTQGRVLTRYRLDTNIISNVVKPRPSKTLVAWMPAQRDEDLSIAPMTVAEGMPGIIEEPRGKTRDPLSRQRACQPGGLGRQRIHQRRREAVIWRQAKFA